MSLGARIDRAARALKELTNARGGSRPAAHSSWLPDARERNHAAARRMCELLARIWDDSELATEYEQTVLTTIKERWEDVLQAAGTRLPSTAYYCRWTIGFQESVATLLERMKPETMVPFLRGIRRDRLADDRRRGDVLESVIRMMADGEHALPAPEVAPPGAVSAAVGGIISADVAGMRCGGLIFCSRCRMFAAETFSACVACGAKEPGWKAYRLGAVSVGGPAI